MMRCGLVLATAVAAVCIAMSSATFVDDVPVTIDLKDTDGNFLDMSTVTVNVRAYRRILPRVYDLLHSKHKFRSLSTPAWVDFMLAKSQVYKVVWTAVDVSTGLEYRGSQLISAPDPATTRRRRGRRSTFEFSVFVPTFLQSTSHYKVVTVWKKELGGPARCDFDSVMTYPHGSVCAGCYVDTEHTSCSTGGGYCVDWTSWPFPSAQHEGDDNCAGAQDPEGIEVIDIVEPGVGTYNHLIYANGALGDFYGSLAQVHVYRKTAAGDIEEIAESHIDDVSSFDNAHRFFHTLQFTLDTPALTYSVVERNLIDCSPNATFGSTAVLDIETKLDPAGLNRTC
eukprot:m.439 g.439  ORF g.439 m.439 type:complete len:339 (+) comp161_c1_seq1:152-1168(+)